MKQYIFFIIFLIQISNSQGEIIEAKNFKEILNHIQEETLVILDIDDTLLIPVQTLGTDIWFLHRYEHYTQLANDKSIAFQQALNEWEFIRHMTKIKIVEEGTEKIVDEIQKIGTAVIGLTTQGFNMAFLTHAQLKSISIDLSKSAPSSQDFYFINGSKGVLYTNGILFTNGTSKGAALIHLLELMDVHPKNIVFINDKKSHLHDVEQSVELKNMTFTGLRYSFSDERIANYSPEIAEIQWKHSSLDCLLSDEEAAMLLYN